MTPAERAATEALLNSALQGLLVAVVVGWWAWWLWRKLGLPGLDWRQLSTILPRAEAPAAGSAAPSARPAAPEPPNARTNEPANAGRTALVEAAEALQLDKTRGAVVAVLVAAGWGTVDIRDLLKGTAADIGAEARQAREALEARAAGEAPARTLVVRDGQGERVITM